MMVVAAAAAVAVAVAAAAIVVCPAPHRDGVVEDRLGPRWRVGVSGMY